MTRKPCPGCGEVDASRKADKICHKCAMLIKEGKQYRVQLRHSDKEPYKYTDVYHWLKYYPGQIGSNGNQRLQQCMVALVAAIAEPVVSHKTYWGGQTQHVFDKVAPLFSINDARDSFCDPVGLFDPKVAEAIDQLDLTIRELLEEASCAGEERGRDLLLQLNDGALTMDRFLEHGLRQEVHREEEKVHRAHQVESHRKKLAEMQEARKRKARTSS